MLSSEIEDWIGLLRIARDLRIWYMCIWWICVHLVLGVRPKYFITLFVHCAPVRE